MEQVICPTCNGTCESSAKYCQLCGQPLRCKQCGTLLSREARACPECGVPIAERINSIGQARQHDGVPPGYNRLRIDQTRDEYHLDYLYSNQVAADQERLISKLATARAMLESDETEPQPASDGHVFGQFQGAVIAPQLPAAGLQPTPPPVPSVDSASDGIWKVFGNSQGKIELIQLDLKCDTQQDYVTRLVRMFLYAHKMLGNDGIAVEEIHDLLDRIGINRKSQSVYLSSDRQGLQKEGDLYKLSLVASFAISGYVADIVDPSKTGKFNPAESRKSRTPKQRNRSKNGDDPKSWAPAASSLVSQVSHGQMNALDNNQKALLGLYGVRLAKGAQFEVGASQLSEYLYAAFEIQLSRDQVRKAVDRLLGKSDGYTIKGKSGTVKITQSGVDYISQTLGLIQPDETDGQSEGDDEGDAE